MEDLMQKIDFVIDRVQSQQKNLKVQLESAVKRLQELNQCPIDDEKKYHYQLEYFSSTISSLKNKIQKNNLFSKRCETYKSFLNAQTSNDLILIEKKKFEFIRVFQEETITDFNSKIELLNQRRILKNISGKESNSLLEKKKVLDLKERTIQKFLNNDFQFDPDKINSSYYLNYATEELIDDLYPEKEHKKAA